MSFARGERVYFDFDSGIGEKVENERGEAPGLPSVAFVGDIRERPVAVANPPQAPTFKANVNGFPAHKKRMPRVSVFKQQRSTGEHAPQAANPPGRSMNPDDERRQIDEENRQRLAGMSAEEIEEERSELLSSLSPSLIQKLLGRANIDEGSNERDLGLNAPVAPTTDVGTEASTRDSKKVSFATLDTQEPEPTHRDQRPAPTPSSSNISTYAPAQNPTEPALVPESDSIHFPKPQQPPDLDPDDPAFLQNLHEKYFPNMPYDPSSLSWMAPIDPSDKSSPYHPSQKAFNAADLRFDFKGSLLAPSIAREIPVTQGLHHHADAPEAAGYTIPELAVMARSAVPAQRCVAYQTLGRILYRLGRGEFGIEKVRQRTEGPVQVATNPDEEIEVDEEDIEVDMDDAGSAMATGLWSCVEEGRVVETLTEEANKEKGHLTARTFAQEALWNWRRGGGRKRQAV